MAFIQQRASHRQEFRLRREKLSSKALAGRGNRAKGELAPTARGSGAWRAGGLLGAVIFSVACWTLVYHGARAVMDANKPAVTAQAGPAPDAPEFGEAP